MGLLGMGSLGMGPFGVDPLGLGSLGVGPLGVGPLEVGHLGVEPLGVDPNCTNGATQALESPVPFLALKLAICLVMGCVSSIGVQSVCVRSVGV